ncbi:MAG: anhydro-N-acetylmuramic acid kinase [Cyanobacteria bacterium J083]|nr:MAG: anhydro-N-acetylmuramic acid kinase [Cyanobacteria bacterium J083]
MRVIGLMSGTSVDGIDAVLVEIEGKDRDLQVNLIAGQTYPYNSTLKNQILAVCAGRSLSMAELASLDDAIAQAFASAAQKIQTSSVPAELIGSHGQTVFHRPPQAKQPLGYSMQLGRGEVIANLTQITTVSNFRQADLAAGGQGAPLVAKVDVYLLGHPSKSRAIQNLGGIGNFTYLPPLQQANWQAQICGWDTGPGNVLLDLAVSKLTQGQQTYDAGGKWAAQGKPKQALVEKWLKQDFFQAPPPKSTGRELFSPSYLEQIWQEIENAGLNVADGLATLTELTVASIAQSYRNFLPTLPQQILLCGGGSRNLYLQERLQVHLPHTEILTTEQVGLNSDFKEAIAFAVLAYWRAYCNFPGNLPQVTGAKESVLLGDIHRSFRI